MTGVIDVTRSGRGFLLQEKGDIPIPREGLGGALAGDIVEVVLSRGRREVIGRVVRVLERKSSTFVGEIARVAGGYTLIPDDPRVYLEFDIDGGAPVGHKVVADIVDWDSAPPRTKVREVIGKSGEHETEIRAIALSKGFNTGFPSAVEAAAEQLAKARVFAIEGREDFRGTWTVTIDPPDAKDFDDAISLKTLENGDREIGIHIADVSYFVTPGSPIDQEAAARATSVYLVDRTIPMLPRALSEDLCSLKPNEDRLTFSAVFTVTPQNEITARRFTKGIIRSARRYTYDEVDPVLTTNPELASLGAFASALRTARAQAGAIIFESEEVKPVLNERGEPTRWRRIKNTASHQLIEELMLLTNREVAAYVSAKLGKKSRLFVYRIHDVPNAERIEELSAFLRAIGYTLATKGVRASGKHFNLMLKAVKGTPEERLIQTATVRSMAKAVYATQNIGHFGLAFGEYTHFTSPIRRYPDLMVHRTLASLVSGGKVLDDPQKNAELAVHASEREAAAAEAERASLKMKQVEYLAKHIGQTRTGIVSGVAEWGIYCEDAECGGEGMARLMTLTDDTYTYDPRRYAAVGARSGRVIRLGDPVTFTIEQVNLALRTIDVRVVST